MPGIPLVDDEALKGLRDLVAKRIDFRTSASLSNRAAIAAMSCR